MVMVAAISIVRIGSSRAAPLLTRGSAAVPYTFSAIVSAPGLVDRARLTPPDRAGRDRHRLRQGVGQTVIDHQHVTELRELDIGLNARSAWSKRRHDPDRKPRREDATLARAHEAVADFDRARFAEIDEPRPFG